jgi:prepilin peptidase CpaA
LLRPSDPVVFATVIAGASLAAAIDLRTRRVPNVLTAALAVAGLALAVTGVSTLSPGASLAGLALGAALMLPGHLLGGTGAGDVKLFAASGALVGPAHILAAFFYTAIAGGALAVAVAVHRRRLRRTLGSAARLVATGGGHAAAIESPLEHNRFAYAPAIAVGVTLAALGL